VTILRDFFIGAALWFALSFVAGLLWIIARLPGQRR
jgi:hypothetical protein